MLPVDRKKIFSLLLVSTFLCSTLLRDTVHADQPKNVRVTAVVPANATDFTSKVSRTTIGPFGQDEQVGIKVTYASLLSYEVDMDVEASWSLGIPEGANTGSVDLLSYELGSASKAYGNAAPVIDLANRKISWHIPLYPGNLEAQSVTFNLRTSKTYVGKLDFTVTGKTIGPGLAIASDELRDEFLYPKQQGVSSPANTPRPTTQASPSVTTTTTAFELQNIAIQELTPTQATIIVRTNLPSDVSLFYGTSPGSLTKGVSSSGNTTHFLTLAGLSENQQYFFRVKATSGSDTITSDLFSFKTAVPGQTPTADLTTLVTVSNNVILTDPSFPATAGGRLTITLPRSTIYDIRLHVNNSKLVKRAEVVVRNKSVLGLSTFIPQVQAADDSVQLLEFSPSIFDGKLRAPLLPGLYGVILRLSDKNGGIHEENLMDINITPPLSVFVQKTAAPIADARVALYYWNDKTQKFEFIAPDRVSVVNPLFTDRNGEADAILPPGTYQAHVFNIGYKEKDVTFSLIGSKDSGYPTIYLEPTTLSIGQVTDYLFASFREVFLEKTLLYLDAISSSQRFFHLTALIILASLTMITLLSFSSRVQLSVFLLPAYLYYHIKQSLQKDQLCITLSGLVTDTDTGAPLSHVNIYLMREQNDEILSSTVTNRHGAFILRHCSTKEVRVVVLKIGYQSLTLHSSFPENPKEPLHFSLTKHPHHRTVRQHFLRGMGYSLSVSFEALMLSSLIVSLFIGVNISWTTGAPFATIALFNFLTWILYQKNLRQLGKHF